MSFKPATSCDECGYESTMKTDICPGCGEKLRSRGGGVRGLLRSVFFLLIAVYILFSAFKEFDFSWR